MASINPPTSTKPTLLRHVNVETLFHELGHGIHYLVGQTRFARFYGTRTTRDFVEIPSKMLENWCWKQSILQALSFHYSYLSHDFLSIWNEENPEGKRPDEKAPLELMESISKTRNLNIAFTTLRQLHLSLFDITIHSALSRDEAERMDLGEIYNRLRRLRACMAWKSLERVMAGDVVMRDSNTSFMVMMLVIILILCEYSPSFGILCEY